MHTPLFLKDTSVCPVSTSLTSSTARLCLTVPYFRTTAGWTWCGILTLPVHHMMHPLKGVFKIHKIRNEQHPEVLKSNCCVLCVFNQLSCKLMRKNCLNYFCISIACFFQMGYLKYYFIYRVKQQDKESSTHEVRLRYTNIQSQCYRMTYEVIYSWG